VHKRLAVQEYLVKAKPRVCSVGACVAYVRTQFSHCSSNPQCRHHCDTDSQFASKLGVVGTTVTKLCSNA